MAMNAQNPLFYTGTFVSTNAAGLMPPTRQNMATLVGAMQSACYGSTFQPDRCAMLSQMVGRLRTEDACAQAQFRAAGAQAVMDVRGLDQPAVATLAAATPPVVLESNPPTVAAALAALGSQSGTGLSVLC